MIYSLILVSWDDYLLSIKEMMGSLREMWIRRDAQREGFRRLYRVEARAMQLLRQTRPSDVRRVELNYEQSGSIPHFISV